MESVLCRVLGVVVCCEVRENKKLPINRKEVRAPPQVGSSVENRKLRPSARTILHFLPAGAH